MLTLFCAESATKVPYQIDSRRKRMVRGLLLSASLMFQFAACGALESLAATPVEGEHPNELQTAQQAVVVSTGGWDDIHWDAATIRAEREQLEESRAPGVHCRGPHRVGVEQRESRC